MLDGIRLRFGLGVGNSSLYGHAMALHELSPEGLFPVAPVNFADVGVRERADLQRILRDRIEIIAPDVLVIAEEFSDWEDCKRRIDLLGLDRSGALVVIEIKRTSDGGHMELQALRYAAMVSALTFDQLVRIYGDFLITQERTDDAMQGILSHLGLGAPEDAEMLDLVRIVLVSADFSREVTTTVLWLNDQGLDITCVRLAAYDLRGTTLVDVQQVIPLPEAQDYTVRLKEKQREIRGIRTQNRDFANFKVICGDEIHPQLNKRRAILAIVTYLIGLGISPDTVQKTIAQKRQRFYQVPGIVTTEQEFIEAALGASKIAGAAQFVHGPWFTGEDELIQFGGNTYSFSKMWGSQTEQKMKDLIDAHGDGKVSYERL
jgi:hypothetical protein